MSVISREGDWLKLSPDIIEQIEQKCQLASQTQIRELLISLALDIATMTDDELLFFPLAYLFQQTPVPVTDEFPIQETLQQYTVPYKLNYFGKGFRGNPLTLDVALMFNKMGLEGQYDTTFEDNLEYVPDFSQALNILLTHPIMTSEDIVNTIHYLLCAGQYRFSKQDLLLAFTKRIESWLQ